MNKNDLIAKWDVKSGQIWQLGDHRLMCGDSTNENDVALLMNGEKASLCFTSPPYALQRTYTSEYSKFKNDWNGLMKGAFKNIPYHDLTQILVNLCFVHSKNEWHVYWDEWIEWMRNIGWRRFGWYVWDKGYGAPGDWAGRLAPSFEFIFHFNRRALKPNKIIPTKTFGRKVHGTGNRRKDNSPPKKMSHDGMTIQQFKIPDAVIRAGKHQQRGIEIQHPAVFSVDLCSQIIMSYSKEGEIIYEPFAGSGTQIIACEILKRKCMSMEISPEYVAISLERWSKKFKINPILSVRA